MKRFLIAVVFVTFVLQGSSAKASDSFAALICGDQDIMILGTITAIEGDRCTIQVEKSFLAPVYRRTDNCRWKKFRVFCNSAK